MAYVYIILLIFISFDIQLGDFGCCQAVEEDTGRVSPNQRSYLTGTFAYRAPEVLRGDPPSIRADVYSFAITLWHMLTKAVNTKSYFNFKLYKYPLNMSLKIWFVLLLFLFVLFPPNPSFYFELAFTYVCLFFRLHTPERTNTW